MISFKARIFSIFLLLLALGTASQLSPTPQEDQSKTVVKANTRLVIVDVVVTDSKGAPVSGLESTDFTVLENGRTQKISNFTFQHPEAAASAPNPLPANVFTNVPSVKTSSLNIILLDALNGQFTSRAHALDELIKYLGSRPAIQPTAIYLLEQKLKLLHDFSTDPESLKTVLAGFKPKVAPHVDDVYSAASAFTQKGSYQTGEETIEATLQALNSLAESLAGYPGRKNLIWLSEAFPVNLFPDINAPATRAFVSRSPTGAEIQPGRSGGSKSVDSSDLATNTATMSSVSGDSAAPSPAAQQRSLSSYGDYLGLVEKVADALMAAQVAVYPIDAAGVGRISRLEALTTMRSMAERAGGKTFASQNDLNSSLRSSMDDGSTYYTLAYYPDDKNWDGKFRHIEVKTTHPGADLRYRLGYYALDPMLESRQKEDAKMLGAEFTQALMLDTPSSTAVLFHATVQPPVAGQKVQVNFAIDPHTLTYREKEHGAEQADLGCAIVAYTGKGAMVRNEINNVVGTVKAEEFPKLLRSNFPCQCTIELKPGKYVLRLGVVDKISKQMGTTTASVAVP